MSISALILTLKSHLKVEMLIFAPESALKVAYSDLYVAVIDRDCSRFVTNPLTQKFSTWGT